MNPGDIFDDLDPWERIVLMQQRIEQLESINNEIVKHIQITSRHIDNLNKSIHQMQMDHVELIGYQMRVNKNGD